MKLPEAANPGNLDISLKGITNKTAGGGTFENQDIPLWGITNGKPPEAGKLRIRRPEP